MMRNLPSYATLVDFYERYATKGKLAAISTKYVNRDRIMAFIYYALGKVRRFNILDFAMLKTCLISAGILIGASFANFFKKYKFFIFATFVISYVYMICRIFDTSDD